jgi:hypothetical protein
MTTAATPNHALPLRKWTKADGRSGKDIENKSAAQTHAEATKRQGKANQARCPKRVPALGAGYCRSGDFGAAFGTGLERHCGLKMASFTGKT